MRFRSIFKRRAAATLAVLLTAASCSCGGQPGGEATSQPDSNPETSIPEETRFTADIPDKTFDGYDFRFLARAESIGKFWHRDIYAETENGDTLNDAVFARNMAVSEKLDIKISPFWVDSANVT